MHFEIAHEIAAAVDAVELAMMAPELGPRIGRAVESLESIELCAHELAEGAFARVWRFQGRTPFRVLRPFRIRRDMMVWDEHASYRLDAHEGTWLIVPRGETAADAPWRAHFHAEGRYWLEPLDGGRTLRRVEGDIGVHFKLVGAIVERVAVGEIRRTYAAEAALLGELCAVGVLAGVPAA